ncbi:MAG: glycerol acyltransferase, partial [Tannerella sp.]|nr:glycerol acyltransferase [Tannerella sp.]
RKLIHSKYRFETLLFAREFFRQRGNTFTLHIGVPVPWQTFDKTKTHREWAILIQKQACALRELPN